MAFQLRLFATLAIVLGVSGDASLHDCAGACPAQHVALVQRHASYASMNQSVDQTSLGQSLCSQAQVLGNPEARLVSTPAGSGCDNSMNGGTFKFPGGLGVLTTSDPSTGIYGGQYCCGTAAPGWFQNAPNYDSMYQYQVIGGTACFSYQSNSCHWSSAISVIKCGDNDFAFTLANSGACSLAYVWEQRTASPTTAPTPSPTTAAPTTVAPTTAAPTTASPTGSPTGSPTAAPTGSPTGSPPGSPTPAPPITSASASGDPHLVNSRGEHFNIFKSGQVEFIRVPYESVTEEADLTVHATIQSFGETDKCKEALYITGLRFDGSWFKGKPLEVNVDFIRPGSTRKGMKVLLGSVPVVPSTDPIDVGDKMALHMHDNQKIVLMVDGASVAVDQQYFFLNVKADSFSKLSQKIGGLLGEDDHSAFSTKPAGCEHEFFVAKAARPVYSSASMSA